MGDGLTSGDAMFGDEVFVLAYIVHHGIVDVADNVALDKPRLGADGGTYALVRLGTNCYEVAIRPLTVVVHDERIAAMEIGGSPDT